MRCNEAAALWSFHPLNKIFTREDLKILNWLGPSYLLSSWHYLTSSHMAKFPLPSYPSIIMFVFVYRNHWYAEVELVWEQGYFVLVLAPSSPAPPLWNANMYMLVQFQCSCSWAGKPGNETCTLHLRMLQVPCYQTPSLLAVCHQKYNQSPFNF